MSTPGLKVTNLSFRHGANPILQGIDLDFQPGRHYVLAGPNGAGKSTLLSLLASLRRPAGGEILLAKRPLESYAPRELARQLAFAQQEFHFDFSFTVRELVAMGRRPHLGGWGRLGAEDRERVETVLGELNLSPYGDNLVTTLSGGEGRRCLVARALVQDTPVVLLDEPTAGLDIRQALFLLAAIRRRVQAGGLVVSVLHDLNLAASHADVLVFLQAGRVVAAGGVEEVFRPDILRQVYDTPAAVGRDAFTASLTASFRL